jgi:hypothetical protein
MILTFFNSIFMSYPLSIMGKPFALVTTIYTCDPKKSNPSYHPRHGENPPPQAWGKSPTWSFVQVILVYYISGMSSDCLDFFGAQPNIAGVAN